MAKSVLYSFRYHRDAFRMYLTRNISTLEEQPELKLQEWEPVKVRGDAEVEWIDREMSYKRALLVLVGLETASRRWLQDEIERAWDLKEENAVRDLHSRLSSRRLAQTASEWARSASSASQGFPPSTPPSPIGRAPSILKPYTGWSETTLNGGLSKAT